jgi:hypothetical protein
MLQPAARLLRLENGLLRVLHIPVQRPEGSQDAIPAATTAWRDFLGGE